MSQLDLRIQRVTAAEVLPLRRAVLRPGQLAAASSYPTDDDAIHVAAILDQEVVCVASMAADPEHPTWRLRGMATADALRRTGIGSQVLTMAVRLAREAGAERIWCNARLPAVPFYEQHGWVVVGDRFELPDIGPHYRMELTH